MGALLRLSVFGLVALTVFYWILRIYLRSVHRERLENEWDADHPDDQPPDDQPRDEAARAAFVEQGMQRYARSLRVKLLWLVYIIPITVVGVLIYLVNYA